MPMMFIKLRFLRYKIFENNSVFLNIQDVKFKKQPILLNFFIIYAVNKKKVVPLLLRNIKITIYFTYNRLRIYFCNYHPKNKGFYFEITYRTNTFFSKFY